MDTTPRLTNSQIQKGRKDFNFFQLLNGASLPFINGSIITLFAIQLGADSTYIGLISSFNYITFMLVYFGRILEPKVGVVQLYAWTWFLRNILMLPILAIPLVLLWDQNQLALSLLLFASIGFNLTRGPGLGANSAVTAHLSNAKTQASYLSFTFMINFGAIIFATVALGLVLRFFNSNLVYTLLIALGLLLGFVSSYFLFKLPKAAKTSNPIPFRKFLQMIFARPAFRIFAIVLFFISFVSAATRPFIVVYMREVYRQSDSNNILLTVAGALGAFLMSAFSKTLVETVGAKTLFIFFTALSTISFIPAVFSPDISGGYMILYLLLFNFIAIFGMQGVESTGQTYLFGIIKKEEIMDAFIIFFIIFGLGGAFGAIAGGELLGILEREIPSTRLTFQIFFSIALLLMIILLVMMGYLKNTNRHSVRTGLGVLINPKNIQAISLANRLEAAKPSEISHILEQIGRLESDAAINLIIESLNSPRLEIRRMALNTLENISGSEHPPELTKAMLHQIRFHTYTTAHIAARILGQHGITQAIPTLRRAVASNDYRLKAEAIAALGRLKDSTSIFLIKRQMHHEANIYVLLSAINALQLLLPKSEVRVLLWPLGWQRVDKIILYESILAAAALLGFLDHFYQRFLRFLENPTEAYNELRDSIQNQKRLKNEIKQTFDPIFQEPNSQLIFIREVDKIFAIAPFTGHEEEFKKALYKLTQNPIFTRYSTFRFFIITLLAAEVVHKKQKL